jgi:hypothetical protein
VAVLTHVTQLEDRRQPTTTLEGWRRFVDADPAEFELLNEDAWWALSEDERVDYNEARIAHYAELVVVTTIQEITNEGRLLTLMNQRENGARRGMIVSGGAATGKTTAIKQLGRFHRLDRALLPGRTLVRGLEIDAHRAAGGGLERAGDVGLAVVAGDRLRDDHRPGRGVFQPLVDLGQPAVRQHRPRHPKGVHPARPHRPSRFGCAIASFRLPATNCWDHRWSGAVQVRRTHDGLSATATSSWGRYSIRRRIAQRRCRLQRW